MWAEPRDSIRNNFQPVLPLMYLKCTGLQYLSAISTHVSNLHLTDKRGDVESACVLTKYVIENMHESENKFLRPDI